MSGLDTNSTAEEMWNSYLGNVADPAAHGGEVRVVKEGNQDNSIIIGCVCAAGAVLIITVVILVVSMPLF